MYSSSCAMPGPLEENPARLSLQAQKGARLTFGHHLRRRLPVPLARLTFGRRVGPPLFDTTAVQAHPSQETGEGGEGVPCRAVAVIDVPVPRPEFPKTIARTGFSPSDLPTLSLIEWHFSPALFPPLLSSSRARHLLNRGRVAVEPSMEGVPARNAPERT